MDLSECLKQDQRESWNHDMSVCLAYRRSGSREDRTTTKERKGETLSQRVAERTEDTEAIVKIECSASSALSFFLCESC